MTSKKAKISPRLETIVDALPLQSGMHVLEIGCGPGVAARAISHIIGNGRILAIDRSGKAIAQAVKRSQDEIESGRLGFRQSSIEDFALDPGEQPFDLAFAVRVGALDGRHPEAGKKALRQIAKVLKPNGKLFIDGGNPLRELSLAAYRQNLE